MYYASVTPPFKGNFSAKRIAFLSSLGASRDPARDSNPLSVAGYSEEDCCGRYGGDRPRSPRLRRAVPRPWLCPARLACHPSGPPPAPRGLRHGLESSQVPGPSSRPPRARQLALQGVLPVTRAPRFLSAAHVLVALISCAPTTDLSYRASAR